MYRSVSKLQTLALGTSSERQFGIRRPNQTYKFALVGSIEPTNHVVILAHNPDSQTYARFSQFPPPKISPSAFVADDFFLCFHRRWFLPLPSSLPLSSIKSPQLPLLSATIVHHVAIHDMTTLSLLLSVTPQLPLLSATSCYPRLCYFLLSVHNSAIHDSASHRDFSLSVSTLPYCC
ncbi:hypothetical protein B296_00022952 [Ensete ventricosum]|uniref:Uncharacterized protein n=1 Tax=Ensete ventricosum TaxID=4639 RepID=A0A426YTC1_ENSVE|nr:hypothetical protein B296_00022952 [Ensete ventricosum]